MKVQNIIGWIKLPFVNLTRRAQFIFGLRLLSLLVSIIFGIALITTKADNLPVSILNCKNSDLASGLYKSLKQTSDMQNSLITTSEIRLLATYIGRHIRGTPEKIKSGLHDWCSIDYHQNNFDYTKINDLRESEDFQAFDDESSNKNITITCKPNRNSYAFDYRSQLSNIGLNIILAYVYNASFDTDTAQTQITNSVSPYAPDTDYTNQLEKRQKVINDYRTLVITAISVDVLIFCLCFIYYGSRKEGEKDDEKIPVKVKNVFAILSTVNLVVSFAAFVTIILQLSRIQHQISEELSGYGIHLKYGITFIVLIIFWVCSAMGVFVLWAGPVWFNRKLKPVNHLNENKLQAYKDETSSCDSHELELHNINDSHDPFHDKNTVDDIKSTVKWPENSKEETKILDAESSFSFSSRTVYNDNTSNLVQMDSLLPEYTENTVVRHDLASHNPFEQVPLSRRPPPLSVNTFKKPHPSVETLAESSGDAGLLPMSPIILSHQNSEASKRD